MRSRLITLLLVLFGLSLVPNGQSSLLAQPDHLAWSQVAGISTGVSFQAVILFDRTSAWAAGSAGTAGVIYKLQFANARWTAKEEQRFAAPINALSVVAPDNIWVVGEQGLVAHKTASGWQTLESALPTGAILRTIQMFGAGEEGWIGGYSTTDDPDRVTVPLLVHYTHGQWQQDRALEGVEGRIDSLHFAADGGWAVGNRWIWRYTNGSWQEAATPSACPEGGSCYGSLSAVRAINGSQAWMVGDWGGLCSACLHSNYYILKHNNATWTIASREGAVSDAPKPEDVPLGSAMPLFGVAFSDEAHGFAVGYAFMPGVVTGNYPVIFGYRAGAWSNEPIPIISGQLQGVSMIDADHALAAGSNGVVLSYGYGPQPQVNPDPTTRVERPSHPNATYFDLVGHTLFGPFTEYWQKNGSLSMFGYPLTEPFGERSKDTHRVHTVQYLERQRFEYHWPDQILLGRLGVEVLLHQGRDWRSFPKADPATAHYYPVTGHAIAPEFWDYWRTHGLDLDQRGVTFAESLALFGYPISRPQMETNSSGETVLTQWFERARFEYHPNNSAEYKVLLGRLAAEVIADRGW